MEQHKKLLIIDGNSMINRAFYGIRALSTSDGRPTNAIYGLINIVRGQLERLKPDYACIAFDVKQPNFRKKIYPAYKEGRHPTPPELLAQFDDAKECMELMGLHTIELPGYEADDVLGTVSTMAAQADIDAYILSGDRDLLQMISPGITVLLATNSDTVPFDRAHFYRIYGVEPEQFIDVKALMGDASDNIPGVAGVGEKTALRLISCFSSLDRIYENIDHPTIKRSIHDKLLAGKEQAYLARRLVTILRDAPVPHTLEELRYEGYRQGLKDKLDSLEFQNLIRKMNLQDTPRTAMPLPVFADDQPITAEALQQLPHGAPVAMHFEGDTLRICCRETEYFSYAGSLAALAPLFDGSHPLILFDGKAFLHRLFREGATVSCVPRDIMLYAYLLNPNGSVKTPEEALSVAFSGDVPEGIPTVGLLFRAEPLLMKKIKEAGMVQLLEDIELPLAPVLAEMEATGCKIHRRGLTAFGVELDEAIDDLTTSIYEMAGYRFNINSPKQLSELLYEKLELPASKRNKSGYSTDVETLERLIPYHPIVTMILDYRQVTKLRSTYVTALLKVADEQDRIHTDFKQALTATGRLSSADPNLQNIPIRTQLGREMRRFFIATDEEHVLVDADYSQIELRLLAHMANDATMIDAFRTGVDIHTRTAALVFDVPEVGVTEELRKRAKAVNFGIIYGIGAFSLSRDLNISTAQAKRYIDSYLDTYAAIRVYMQTTIDKAKELGYTTTLFGRRRYVPELRAQNKNTQAFGERVVKNSPIQGTAADLMKLAMIRVDARLKKECPEARLIMQVHDELIVEAPRKKAALAAKILRQEMEGAAKLSVPLSVDVQTGDNWLGDS